MNTAELHWIAGLLEGEGSFGVKKNSPHTASRYLHITMNTTDLDVGERLCRLTRQGALRGPYAPRGPLSKKPRWVWQTWRQANVAGLMMTLYPLMGERRQEQIRQSLAVWRVQGKGRRHR